MKTFYKQLNLPKVTAIFMAVLGTQFSQAQVTFTNQGSLLQSVSGTSVADCAADMNGDGLDDIIRVFGNGIYIDYQQLNGTFQPAFFPMTIATLPNWSICAADIDGNGFTDLMLGSGSRVAFVYANNTGTGYVEDQQPEYIFTQRTTFQDIDNDGNLDAFACHDVAQNRPYRNIGGVLSYDISLLPTLAVGGNYAAIWVDYDNDWDSDLYITKCRGGAPVGDPQRINLLYRNDGNGVFTSVGPEANMDDGDQSWATVFEDFDNDGDFDSFTVNHSVANRLMRNNGDGTFTNIISSSGINATDLGAWNCDAGDFDNNGFVDIFSEMNAEMYWNNGNGTFTAGNLNFDSGGIGDFNNDGFLDVIAGNNLWINNGNSNNYIKFDLEGLISNKSAIGARVEIYGAFGIQVREVRSGESFDPGSSLMVHFGLGTHTQVTQAVIKWPSGMVTTLNNPAINQMHFVLEAGCLNDPVTVTSSGSTAICQGQSVTLTAPAGVSYNWSNGATTQSIEVTNAGMYTAIVWGQNECASVSAPVIVTYVEQEVPVITLQGDAIICEGSSTTLVSSQAQSYAWSSGGSEQQLIVTQPGDYHVSVSGLCSGTAYQSNTISIQVLPSPTPVVANATIGEPGTATLTATGNNLQWFASETSTEVLGTGNEFTTGIFTDQISYWVQGSTTYGGEELFGGKLDNTGAGGLPSTGGRLFFTANEAFTLQQATVYTSNNGVAGNRTIQLFDAAGTLLQETVVFCPVGMSVIDINFNIIPGNYQIGVAENNLFRNSGGVTMPYAVGDVATINNTTFGTAYYYYLYNWKVKKPEIICETPRVQATAQVVSVQENRNPLGISIFPNPVSDELSISSQHASGNLQLQLTDITGKTVMTKQINLSAGGRAVLQTANLSAGMYQVKLTQGQQTSVIPLIKE